MLNYAMSILSRLRKIEKKCKVNSRNVRFNLPDIKIISWYSINSLAKTLLDGGTSEIYDDNNQPIGSFHSWDIFEYLGTGHIDKDTLIPWSQR